jgi:hypothetical protein
VGHLEESTSCVHRPRRVRTGERLRLIFLDPKLYKLLSGYKSESKLLCRVATHSRYILSIVEPHTAGIKSGFKFGENQAGVRIQDVCFLRDTSGTIRGAWVRNQADANNPVFRIAVFLKGGLSSDAIAGFHRIVPNTLTDEGGCFVMLGSFPAPGEADRG